jgi:hypothetical protein
MAEPPALFTGLIGRPSSGKSPGLDVVTGLLSRLESGRHDDWDERRRAHEPHCAAAKERRSRWEKEVKGAVKAGLPPPDMPADAEDPEPPQPRRLFSTEPTVQKTALLVHSNPRGLLLVRDELAGWVGGVDLYTRGDGNDRAFWLQAYGGRRWTPDRVKDGDNAKIIPHLLWGLSGGIQPDAWRANCKPAMMTTWPHVCSMHGLNQCCHGARSKRRITWVHLPRSKGLLSCHGTRPIR